MKHINISTLLVLLYANVLAQSVTQDKPVIDSTAINEWVKLGAAPVISNNGKYVSYIINNQPVNSNTLVIQSTSSSWKSEFPGAVNGFFSKDNKQFIFKKDDTLYFLNLGTKQSKYLTQVGSYQQPAVLKGEWLACQMKNDSMTLIVKNLLTGKEQSFNDVAEYTFADQGNVLLLKRVSDQNNSINLTWVNLARGKATNIWSAPDNNTHVINYSMDPIGAQLAFMVQQPTGENTIWYYDTAMNQAVIKAGNHSVGITGDLIISNFPVNFSENGKYIFFRLQMQDAGIHKKTADAVDVDVWSYKDSILQSTQLLTQDGPTYVGVIGVDKSEGIRLTYTNQAIVCYPSKTDYVVVKQSVSGDKFWLDERVGLPGYVPDLKWLVSLENGSRKPIKTDGNTDFFFSPGGRYLVYNDTKQNLSFYSYNLETGETANISEAIGNGLLAKDNLRPTNGLTTPVGIAGWLQDDNALLVYDNYDIWQLDLTGKKLPINITNGFGRTHHIRFRVVNEKKDSGNDIIFKSDQLLLLTAFNTNNKYNGFYKKHLNENVDPKLMVMGPWTFFTCPGQAPGVDLSFSTGMCPVKAANVDNWIVRRENSSQAPNYFLTKDFRKYTALTNLQPQHKYNWLTTELISWKQLDGTLSEGILYKPENFDPGKSYPLLIHYYAKMSGRLYQFPAPEFMESNIDIPWFVSRGYLVFTPDIHFAFGKFGQSTCNSVISATQMLSILPYVDAKHIGISGQSTAGFQTNYLVTHSNLFAAALEGSGTSDCISSALQLAGKGYNESSRLGAYEWMMGASIWERPDLYLENSPILKAHQVTTPLLIFHCRNDNAVPWAQAVELFIALRRLEKPVWMLQYNNGNHGVWEKDAVDYSVRVTQFFDHYLKGAPPPKWMTKGIPANLKGIETGYELDTEAN